MSSILEKVKQFFIHRQQAYQAVFHPDSVHARMVLKDLAHFCRATETTFHVDPRLHAVLEGRREVWLRIEEHLKLTSAEVWALHGKDMG